MYYINYNIRYNKLVINLICRLVIISYKIECVKVNAYIVLYLLYKLSKYRQHIKQI